jgi:hypothetical protein
MEVDGPLLIRKISSEAADIDPLLKDFTDPDYRTVSFSFLEFHFSMF